MEAELNSVLALDKTVKEFLDKDVEYILKIDLALKTSVISTSIIHKSITTKSDCVISTCGAPLKCTSDNALIASPTNRCLVTDPLPLLNPGNYCYINASIQALLSSIDRHLHASLRVARSHKTQAIELFNELLDQLERGATGWSVIDNIRSLRYFSRNLRSGAQEDAQEFLNGFLDRLRDEFDQIPAFSGPTNPVRQSYGISYDTRYYCTACGQSNVSAPSIQEELVFLLELDADSLPSMVRSSLNTFTGQHSCDHCKSSSGSARMRGVLTCPPRTLICCLKRFQHNPLSSSTKINREIDFARQLLIPFTDRRDARRVANYELSSIVVHLGTSVNNGHYECVSRLGGRWFRVSDSVVAEIDEAQAHAVAKNSSYIYTFRRAARAVTRVSSARKRVSSPPNAKNGPFGTFWKRAPPPSPQAVKNNKPLMCWNG